MKKLILYITTCCILFMACMESSGPTASQNFLSGYVNLDELSGIGTSDIWVYLVAFEGGGMARVDSVHPVFDGEYEFVDFELGLYSVEAVTAFGTYPEYYGFHDNNFDNYFSSHDAISFSSYAHINEFNVPLYGSGVDTFFYEYEPNDYSSSAQNFEIIHKAHVDGDISSGGFSPPDIYTGDLDLYRFESVWDGYMVIELTWSDYSNLDLFLYDRDGFSVIDQSASDYQGQENIYRSVYRSEEFIVLVASYDNPANYELVIRIE